MRCLAGLTLLALSALQPLGAGEPPCLAAAQRTFPGLRLATVENGLAIGDFDADGTNDIALLLEGPSAENSRVIAVCLSSRTDEDPLLITDLYVSDSLSVTPKGTRFYDYETDEEGIYERDGISVRCCECCGATYIYSNGGFERIIDGD